MVTSKIWATHVLQQILNINKHDWEAGDLKITVESISVVTYQENPMQILNWCRWGRSLTYERCSVLYVLNKVIYK